MSGQCKLDLQFYPEILKAQPEQQIKDTNLANYLMLLSQQNRHCRFYTYLKEMLNYNLKIPGKMHFLVHEQLLSLQTQRQ